MDELVGGLLGVTGGLIGGLGGYVTWGCEQSGRCDGTVTRGKIKHQKQLEYVGLRLSLT